MCAHLANDGVGYRTDSCTNDDKDGISNYIAVILLGCENYFLPDLVIAFFFTPITPRLVARRILRKLGHSIWLGAAHLAACRSPSRMADSLSLIHI